MSKDAHYSPSGIPKKRASRHSRRTLEDIVKAEGDFPLAAYLLVFEALDYTAKLYGKNRSRDAPEGERHVTGQQLVEGIRRYALEKFGYIAKVVLNQFSITTTRDFGRIVFFLVDHDLMGKTDQDSIDDFVAQYDFDKAFDADFVFAADSDLDLSEPTPYFHAGL